MRLTQFTDYSLRVLIYLGLNDEGPLCTIRDIARHYKISENHLMKVVHGLSQLGYVDAVRGRGGGLKLARSPDLIRVGDVVRDIEKDTVLVECFDADRNACCITEACALRHALAEAQRAFFAVLDRYRLSDLLRPRTTLQRLLRMPA
ncbi:MAG TPA: Rrf2 family transcriptional regulator [Alphaproteobacteria bacterium]|nr:Rrf2 family transcriptional regulator [Alphaproteobacteria bacterium]